MDMPIITVYLKHELREIFAPYTRYYYPAHAGLDAVESFGDKYAEKHLIIENFL